MEDELTSSLDGKTLGNLRVVDLKQELEKRGLSKSGSKKDLVKRLKQQLEFEKLCEEQKSTGDCDLKKELDAATEQNEFVQRYLAQQQKIYAEQKEMKRLIELEESKKLEEKESCHSPHIEENHSTDDDETENEEISDSENIVDKDVDEKGVKDDKVNSVDTEASGKNFEKETDNDKNCANAESFVEIRQQKKDVDKSLDESNVIENEINTSNVKNETCDHKIVKMKSDNKCIITCKADGKNNLDETDSKNVVKDEIKETVKDKIEDSDVCKKDENKIAKNIAVVENKMEEKDADKSSDDLAKSETEESNVIVISELHKSEVVSLKELEKNSEEIASESAKSNNNNKIVNISGISSVGDLSKIKSKEDNKTPLIIKESVDLLPSSTTTDFQESEQILKDSTYQDNADMGFTDSSATVVLMDKVSDMDLPTSLSSVPVSLSEIQLPQSPDDIVKPPNKRFSNKEDAFSSPTKKKEENHDSQNSSSDNEVQRNGISSTKRSSKHLKGKSASDHSCDAEFNSKPVKDVKKDSSDDSSKHKLKRKQSSDAVPSDSEDSSKHNLKRNQSLDATPSDSEEKSSSEVERVKDLHSSSSEKDSKSADSSSSSEESSQSEEERRRKPKRVAPSRNRRRRHSSSGSRSSQSRESSPVKSSNHKIDIVHKEPISSETEEKTFESVSDKNNDKKSPCAVTEKSAPSLSDPPRKKLKINRNNVVIAHSPTGNVAVSPEKLSPKEKSQKEKEKLQDPVSPIQVSSEPEREMGEIIDNIPEVKYEPRKLNFPGRKVNRKSTEDHSSEEPKLKKSKWGRFASALKSSQTINISTDSLKNWFPDFKLVTEPAPVSESVLDDSPPIKEDKKLSFPSHPETDIEIKQTVSVNAVLETTNEPSPEVKTEMTGPVSKIVFIQNLVRPFTLLQLKELLRQTGNFIEDEFWIDKIKSKCFVTYETEEEAIKTRNALNGTRWPSSNPKILSAEFSTEEELELYRSGGDIPKVVPEPPPENKDSYEPKISQSSGDHRKRDADKRKEKDRYRPQMPIREWDKDKVSQESPDRDTFGKVSEGPDKKDKKDAKKRPNEDTPAKLLDDLFQKTKVAPCIYWLPLTEALVLEREEARRLRRLEREKRIQQREQEESEHKNKRPRSDHKSRETDNRRSSTRSRSPTSRRR